MISAELVVDYTVIEKPFRLIERHAHCGGTEYTTICRLCEDHAALLANEGISWLHGEPDWEKHWRKIEIMKAEREKLVVENRIEKLRGDPS